MSYKLSDLKNEKTFSGLVVYRYLCESWKREHPHEVHPISDKAHLKFKSDIILFKIEKARWFEEYVKPYRLIHSRRKYMNMKRRIENFSYEQLTTIYKVTMNPLLNPLRKD